MNKKDHPLLSEIREKLGRIHGIEKRDFLKCNTVPHGIPKGTLCEITGSARTEWILDLFKQNPDLNIFWVEDQLTLLPTALEQRGINLSRILLAEAGDKLFQTLRKGLRSHLFDCIVLPGAIHEIKVLRALQLFSRESNTTVFFLSKVAKNAWAISLQLNVNWSVSLLKNELFSHSELYTVEITKSKFSKLQAHSVSE